MQVKTCPVEVKAAGTADGTEEGVFEAIVAAYNVDSVGDRIMPGAFAKTLAAWKESGSPIPVVWSHRSDDPEYHIGVVEEAEERPEGLWVKGRLDMDEAKPAKIYRLLKGRRVRNFSFAYDEVDARPSQKNADGAKNDLHELKVYEVGPTLIGCNQQTDLLGVKHAPPDDTPARQLGPRHAAVLRKGHGMTARDLRSAIDSAVGETFGGRGRYVWVRDYTDDWAVISVYSETALETTDALHQVSYSVADGVVTLVGDPVEVVERTVYTPKTPATAAAASDTTQASSATTAAAEKNDQSTSDAAPATPAEPAAASASQAAPVVVPEAKASEPARPGTASARLRTQLELLELEAGLLTI